jgi:nucleotide-binding universal stress UspA family protein
MKRVLIVIDGSPNDPESLTSAVLICQATGASLTVAHARQASIDVQGLGDLVFAQARERQWQQAEQAARQAFEAACADLPGRDFAVYDATAEAIIDALGHAFDLIVVERISELEGPQAAALNAAVFATGRPALVAPPLAPETACRHAAIAWNGSAQAARAVKSALPLLTAAEQVTLLLGSGMEAGPPLPIDDYLQAYGIAARVHPYVSSSLTARGRGRALLGVVRDIDADLLVTGAYGEARGAAIGGLGRATQKVVTGAPVPVLIQS